MYMHIVVLLVTSQFIMNLAIVAFFYNMKKGDEGIRGMMGSPGPKGDRGPKGDP